MLDIDAAACKKAGISPSDILSTMQGYFGGLYASNFNSFGKMYRVMVQAEPEATKNLESLSSIKVRNGDEMAPITQFVSIKKAFLFCCLLLQEAKSPTGTYFQSLQNAVPPAPCYRLLPHYPQDFHTIHLYPRDQAASALEYE